MTHGDGGKGSGRRKEDASKVRDNWDLIFGAKAPESSPLAAGLTEKGTMMNEHEHDDDEIDHSEEEWTCDVCGGPMYSAAHWNYGKCDDCGATQELINDDYL
jgi:rubrerythrin